MNSIKIVTTICLVFSCTFSLVGQHIGKLTGGNSVGVLMPKKGLSGTYDHGLGIYANFEYSLIPFIDLRADLGWNDFAGPETYYTDVDGVVHANHPSRSIWEISGGAKVKLAFFYIEGRVGYFTSVKDIGYVPAIGLRIGKFDIQGSYAFAGDVEWGTIRLGYYWSK